MAAGKRLVIFGKGWVLLVAVVFSLGMMVSPAAGVFSIKKEREAGEKLLFEVRRVFPLLDAPDLVQYLNSLGRQVLDVAGPQYFQYRYYLIQSPQLNAFAAPSGMIFFFSGLILQMNSENELIAVLAHETGHVVKRHIAAGAKTGIYANAAALGLAILGATLGGSAAPALITGALAAGKSVNLHYNRQHEQEADLCAYQWMKKMGRNPAAELSMLKGMRRIARYRREKLPQYLLTHPNPEERMGVIESLIAEDNDIVYPEEGDNFAFLRFKYRILAKVKDIGLVRTYLQNMLVRADIDKEDRAMAQYGLSQLARREKDYPEALALIRKVRSVFPERNELMVDQGIIEADLGDTDNALLTLRQAVVANDNNMYGYFALGKLLKRLGKYREAVKCFTRVQSFLPEYPQLFFEWGQLENVRGNIALSLFYLGKYNLYEGRVALAKEEFEQALQKKSLSSEKEQEAKDFLLLIKRVRERL